MTKTALQVLASNLKVIKSAKAKYEETIQDSIEVFLNNYETTLSRNSKPLQDLLNAVASKDVGIIKWYLSKCTNIKQLKTNDKGNLQIVTEDKQPLAINDFITDKAWYELKVQTKVTEDFKDIKHLLQSFNSLFNKLNKSVDKLGIQSSTVKAFENLKEQLESYKA